jgi:hypothetical protein
MPEFPGTLKPPRLASAPSSPALGQLYYNTGSNQLLYWNGTAWIAPGAAGAPGPQNEQVLQVKVFDDAGALATGDGKAIVCVSDNLNGLSIVDADAYVTTNGSTLTTVALRRIRSGAAVDILTTPITIDASEPTSYTAAAQPVIDAANDDVLTGDLIAVDVDGAGTGAKGLGVVIAFA